MAKKLGGTFHLLHLHMSRYFSSICEPLNHFTHSANIFHFKFSKNVKCFVALPLGCRWKWRCLSGHIYSVQM